MNNNINDTAEELQTLMAATGNEWNDFADLLVEALQAASYMRGLTNADHAAMIKAVTSMVALEDEGSTYNAEGLAS